jgi:hypothetical protein
VFWKAIQANGEKNDVDIVNLFYFTLKDVISEWGEKIYATPFEIFFCKVGNIFLQIIPNYAYQ